MSGYNYEGLGRLAEQAEQRVADISTWIDTWPANQLRDQEALGWHRVTKVSEEAGEVWDAWLLYVGGNPRKPAGPLNDVIDELLDTANAALAGVEHLTGNRGTAVRMLFEKITMVHKRAGLS